MFQSRPGASAVIMMAAMAPGHDFPQKVIYFRKGEGLLIGRIEGKVKGNFKAIDFPMKRTACP